MSKEKRTLGRGLSALLADDTMDMTNVDQVKAGIRTINIAQLKPGKYQPRQQFLSEEIDALAESIRTKGILQPLLVRAINDDQFEIIAGERRWRAAQKAELIEVPVIIKELEDRDALEIAIIENVQRQDLSAIEEAIAYQRLMDEFKHTQEAIANAVGKSRSHIANILRLLNLPESVQNMIREGKLSAGHAKVLVGHKNAEKLAEQIIEQGLNVRETERLVQGKTNSDKPKTSGSGSLRPKLSPLAAGPGDPDTSALEQDLSNLLGLRVSIRFNGKAGELTIHYNDLDQLDELLHRLTPSGA